MTRQLIGAAIAVLALAKAPDVDGVFEALLSDDAQAWELRSNGSWRRIRPPKGERRRSSQLQLMHRARSRQHRLGTLADD